MRSGLAGGNKRGHCIVLGHIRRQEHPEWWLSRCRREVHDDKSGRKECVRQEGGSQIYFGSYGCKSELTVIQGKEGIVIVKTHQAILVAHYPETVQPGQATNTVEQLGDYLIGVGY